MQIKYEKDTIEKLKSKYRARVVFQEEFDKKKPKYEVERVEKLTLDLHKINC